jgi:hypothetical protein
MKKRSEKFDRDEARDSIAEELKKLKGKTVGCAGPKGISGLAKVPKRLVRELAESHPDVEVIRDGKRYVYRHKGPY